MEYSDIWVFQKVNNIDLPRAKTFLLHHFLTVSWRFHEDIRPGFVVLWVDVVFCYYDCTNRNVFLLINLLAHQRAHRWQALCPTIIDDVVCHSNSPSAPGLCVCERVSQLTSDRAYSSFESESIPRQTNSAHSLTRRRWVFVGNTFTFNKCWYPGCLRKLEHHQKKMLIINQTNIR
jgi:hypothetical protein